MKGAAPASIGKCSGPGSGGLCRYMLIPEGVAMAKGGGEGWWNGPGACMRLKCSILGWNRGGLFSGNAGGLK